MKMTRDDWNGIIDALVILLGMIVMGILMSKWMVPVISP